MISVIAHPEGAVLPVLAQPGAKRSAILGQRAGALRVAVTSQPEKGKANQAIAALLAKVLACRASQIALLSGATSRQKRFLFEGMTPEDLKDRLASVVPGVEVEPCSGPATPRIGNEPTRDDQRPVSR
jgi:uncharacterized protein